MLRTPPSRPLARSTAAFLALLLGLGLVAVVAGPAGATGSGAAAGPVAAKTGVRADRTVRARAALANAKRALSRDVPARERPDASVALRRLWLLRDALPKTERATARDLAGRPATNRVDCTSAIACVHWSSGQTTKKWAQTVRRVVTHVGRTYRQAGYQAPLSDHGRGGSDKTDVYITDLPAGLYGYCTTDQPTTSRATTAWAFCVLDNDYAGFPAHTPVQNLEVTTAHEYYHAVQFGYDIDQDRWLMEATAVTMEDELYPKVNDNLQYLADSPITQPGTSLDAFIGTFPYGAWNFFRYLIEEHHKRKGPLPALLLRLWQQTSPAHGTRTNRDSVHALDRALRSIGSSLAAEFTRYSDAIRRTHSVFDEGAALDYPVKPLAGSADLTSAAPTTRFTGRLDHLTSATYHVDLDPAAVAGGGSALKVKLDLTDRVHGSAAVVSTYTTNGKVRTRVVKLNARGNGTLRIRRLRKVAAVEVTAVNTSTRFTGCYRAATPYTCSGRPLDQREPHHVVVKLTSRA